MLGNCEWISSDATHHIEISFWEILGGLLAHCSQKRIYSTTWGIGTVVGVLISFADVMPNRR